MTKAKTPRRRTEGELGTEWECMRCHEDWPGTTEFFYWDKRSNQPHSWCKACYLAAPCVRRREARSKATGRSHRSSKPLRREVEQREIEKMERKAA